MPDTGASLPGSRADLRRVIDYHHRVPPGERRPAETVLVAAVEMLREALAFYAHPEHLEEDRGAIARDALGEDWLDEWKRRPYVIEEADHG